MIIVRILGGLGNQLFQYAAGKALAEQRKTDFKLDISDLGVDLKRSFELNNFNTKVSLATAEEIRKLKATTSLLRVKSKLTPYQYKTFYKQPYFHFDSRFFSLGREVYLQGYFQSQKYFLPVADMIKDAYKLTKVLSEQVNELSQEIKDSNSVSLHIRRGDYKDALSRKIHGIIPLAYYQKAIAFFKVNLKNEARFYIFSDDPVAVQRELDLKEATLVSGNFTRNHLEDFYLMTQCRHNIIANSSFSWWAAWLNENSEKKVVAPVKWFNKGPKDTYDLFPEDWIRF